MQKQTLSIRFTKGQARILYSYIFGKILTIRKKSHIMHSPFPKEELKLNGWL